MSKIGRNEPCPCGSGKKYKKCHGYSVNIQPTINEIKFDDVPPEIIKAIEQQKAKEFLRKQQQGLGNPIISVEYQGYRIVAVGNVIHYSKDWKTFHDFLFYYIRKVMDGDWGNEEISKPYEDRHMVLQWYDQLCKYQKDTIKEPGKVSSSPMIGAVEAYLNLAYNLYLLGHNTIKNEFNTKLQNRLLTRLKNKNDFPGAYYESYVCASLIRAGFEVELEDEKGGGPKHCDFTITCKDSRKKYTVEAKCINREGALGARQNTTKAELQKSIKNQLYKALKKPSADPRIIFINVNLSSNDKAENLRWINESTQAVTNAEDLTVDGLPTEPAYVIFTNHTHHYHPDATKTSYSVVSAGYKIQDFGYGKEYKRLRDIYFAKQKHIDIHDILKSLESHHNIPSTFDGALPSEAFHGYTDRIKIGETYLFDNIGQAKVTTAIVSKVEKCIVIGTNTGHILKHPISDIELEDYERHPDTFFGVIHPQGKNTDEPYDLFEWMLDSYSKTPKERLLEFMNNRKDIEQLKLLTQEELAIIYCEGCVYSILQQRDKK